MRIIAPCPQCGLDLVDHGDLCLIDIVAANHAAEGEPVLDLTLTCESCGTVFNAFVPLSLFSRVDNGAH